MANFKKVNQQVKSKFPGMDVEVVRGDGYVYFAGEYYDKIDSIMTHPVSTSTDDLIRMAVEEIEYAIKHNIVD